ncbi:MAG: hypothetical protein M1822_003705 [Bathelium mastoideum]|nr:MAG: hypothetical protein M1822_003705 [Bathelium mastoideum]
MHRTWAPCRVICTSKRAFDTSVALSNVFHVTRPVRRLATCPILRAATPEERNKAFEHKETWRGRQSAGEAASLLNQDNQSLPERGQEHTSLEGDGGRKNQDPANGVPLDGDALEMRRSDDGTQSTEVPVGTNRFSNEPSSADASNNEDERFGHTFSIDGSHDERLADRVSSMQKMYQWKNGFMNTSEETPPMRSLSGTPMEEIEEGVAPTLVRRVYRESSSKHFTIEPDGSISDSFKRIQLERKHPADVKFVQYYNHNNKQFEIRQKIPKDYLTKICGELPDSNTFPYERETNVSPFSGSLGQMKVLSENLESHEVQPTQEAPNSSKQTQQEYININSSTPEDIFDGPRPHRPGVKEPVPTAAHRAQHKEWKHHDEDEVFEASEDGSADLLGEMRPVYMPIETSQMKQTSKSRPEVHKTAGKAQQVAEPSWLNELEKAIGKVEQDQGSPRPPPSKRPASRTPEEVNSKSSLEAHSSGEQERHREAGYVPLPDDDENCDFSAETALWMGRDFHFPKVEKPSGQVRLQAEIFAFQRWCRLNKVERLARAAVSRAVEDFVTDSLNGHSVVAYGSSTNSMDSPTSDLDFALVDQHRHHSKQQKNRKRLIAKLWRLYRGKPIHGKQFTPPRLHQGRHPLLALNHRPSGTEVQIVATDVSQQSWVDDYRDGYLAFRSVFFVVKSILEARKLTEVYNGGIGGYTILAMVAASFRHHPKLAKDDTAGHLMAFLDFYSNFDTTKYGIDLITPEIFEKTGRRPAAPKTKGLEDQEHDNLAGSIETEDVDTEEAALEQEGMDEHQDVSDFDPQETSSNNIPNTTEPENSNEQTSDAPPTQDKVLAGRSVIARTKPSQPYLLCLQDPADSTNDLGRKSYAIRNILATFRHLRSVLQRGMDEDNQGRKIPTLRLPREMQPSLLMPLVGPTFCADVTYRRFRLKFWFVTQPRKIPTAADFLNGFRSKLAAIKAAKGWDEAGENPVPLPVASAETDRKENPVPVSVAPQEASLVQPITAAEGADEAGGNPVSLPIASAEAERKENPVPAPVSSAEAKGKENLVPDPVVSAEAEGEENPVAALVAPQEPSLVQSATAPQEAQLAQDNQQKRRRRKGRKQGSVRFLAQTKPDPLAQYGERRRNGDTAGKESVVKFIAIPQKGLLAREYQRSRRGEGGQRQSAVRFVTAPPAQDGTRRHGDTAGEQRLVNFVAPSRTSAAARFYENLERDRKRDRRIGIGPPEDDDALLRKGADQSDDGGKQASAER